MRGGDGARGEDVGADKVALELELMVGEPLVVNDPGSFERGSAEDFGLTVGGVADLVEVGGEAGADEALADVDESAGVPVADAVEALTSARD